MAYLGFIGTCLRECHRATHCQAREQRRPMPTSQNHSSKSPKFSISSRCCPSGASSRISCSSTQVWGWWIYTACSPLASAGLMSDFRAVPDHPRGPWRQFGTFGIPRDSESGSFSFGTSTAVKCTPSPERASLSTCSTWLPFVIRISLCREASSRQRLQRRPLTTRSPDPRWTAQSS